MGPKSIILLVACACLVGGCVYILYDFNGGSLDLSDREVVLVVTDSMDGDVRGYAVDSFPADTLIMVQHIPDHEKRFLRVGEVITYHTEGGVLVCHRIFGMDGTTLYVRGDNGTAVDKVQFEQVSGRVVGASPVLGKIVSFSESNYLPLLGVAAVAFCALLALALYPSGKRECEVD